VFATQPGARRQAADARFPHCAGTKVDTPMAGLIRDHGLSDDREAAGKNY
jgi:hypothetical protein